MKMALIVVAVLIGMALGALQASAQIEQINRATDYQCMNECNARGFMYGYCKKLCSY